MGEHLAEDEAIAAACREAVYYHAGEAVRAVLANMPNPESCSCGTDTDVLPQLQELLERDRRVNRRGKGPVWYPALVGDEIEDVSIEADLEEEVYAEAGERLETVADAIADACSWEEV